MHAAVLSTNRLYASSMAVAVRDSTATKGRLLKAATKEFAAHGIAGARVERIAAQAGANKQLIYAYFGSKDGLFDAALAEGCTALMDSVPFDPEDIPGYVGRLFDYAVAHPDVYRLVAWAGLERPNAIAQFEADSYGAKLAAIAHAQRKGRLDASLAPADLLALAIGIAGSWFSTSEAVRRYDSTNPWSPKRTAQFRDAAVEATTRIIGA
jgi:AcrR family transcriptional regulator